jgi:isoleucyl-tRNA synthetase
MTNTNYSINAPKTDFPMKANSAVREVELQKRWEDQKIYERVLAKRKGAKKFVLHDGPPYLSSAKIHIGTALNKILKDIVTKYASVRGFYSPYVPGYDSHGLPIETAVLKEVKGGRNALTPIELRQRCREFALQNLKGQEANFKRLGVWGDWEHPYITLDQHYEAAQIRVFGQMADKGYLYKGLKSVSWCTTCETALAEAEIEYADHESQSIYVKFAIDPGSYEKLPKFAGEPSDVAFLIWTTTPWTLPANLAIALNREFLYDFIKTKTHGTLVVAEALRARFLEVLGLAESDVEVLGRVPGADLELIKARHPFVDRTSLVILGDHVSADAGTGCVHTAPGHGPEDFEIGARYKLGVLSPLDERGIFTSEAGQFAGLHYAKGQQPIIEALKESGALLNFSKFVHSYPHCWRCKQPLIFRATEQWFASVDGFREQALKAIDEVEWHPASGRNRIYSMVESRADWCISRQRAWGVPIPIFFCQSCKTPLMSAKSIGKVADVFDKEGSDSWWAHEDAKYFLGDNFKCNCGSSEFTKETDTMDVWFDSGSSHAAVLDQRPELMGTPCEMYLEGSDQHRGWFMSSLLTSVAIKGRAPYKAVLTHGFVVDENGRKFSKSLGNAVDPNEVIKQYGADVLRLWVASVNYTDDVPIGKNMLVQLAEVYRKLRNTARYLLSNLYDFDPATDAVDFDELKDLDRFILHRLSEVSEEVLHDFDRYEYFKYYQVLQNFCVVDLSSFYFDIVKDRLYTSGKKSLSRRAVQTTLQEVLHVLVHMLVPVTPHLAEDIWDYIPEAIKKHWHADDSVLLGVFPELPSIYKDAKQADRWNQLMRLRSVVTKALEIARTDRTIKSSLEAKVFLNLEDSKLESAARELEQDHELAPFFITSQAFIGIPGGIALDGAATTLAIGSASKSYDKSNVPVSDKATPLSTTSLATGPAPIKLAEVREEGITVVVSPANGLKCARCWKFVESVGSSAHFPEICSPCIAAIA